jgi:hypothetical protein
VLPWEMTMVLQVLGCQLVRCSLVAAIFQGVSLFIFILLLRSSTMTFGDGVRCERRRLSGAVLLQGSATNGQNGVRCCLSSDMVGAIFL